MDDDVKTSLFLAIEKDNVEIVKLLLSNPSIDVNKGYGNKAPLLLAIEKDNVEIVKLLLSNPSINVNQESETVVEYQFKMTRIETTALFLTIYQQKIETLKILIQQKGIVISNSEKQYINQLEVSI